MNIFTARSIFGGRVQPAEGLGEVLTAPEPVPIFTPDPRAIAASRMTAFIRYCEAHTGQRLPDTEAFHRFSVEHYRRFWRLFLTWSRSPCEGSTDPVCVG